MFWFKYTILLGRQGFLGLENHVHLNYPQTKTVNELTKEFFIHKLQVEERVLVQTNYSIDATRITWTRKSCRPKLFPVQKLSIN